MDLHKYFWNYTNFIRLDMVLFVAPSKICIILKILTQIRDGGIFYYKSFTTLQLSDQGHVSSYFKIISRAKATVQSPTTCTQ